ncbi:MAG: hypothetical protein IKC08_05725 [Lentisphaeria bacterium]|nr:hypothetical protein [Lentisphaeria bacterium]
MKKTFFTAALFAAVMLTASLLSAQTKKIPILWKAKTTAPAKFQIMAFGYLNDKDDVIFAYQIKDLAELMKLDSHLSQYFNTDNDINTGRFPKNQGVDLQINGRIRDKANFGPIKWDVNNKSTNLPAMKGEKAFVQNGDVIFFIISKGVLESIKFTPQFKINAGYYIKGMKKAPAAIPGYHLVDTAKTFGTFDMPEPK